ncbi:hypothetical protein SOVF_200450 isoform C [Spinacia oleracea]|nr:hypothetical protein SOVF_200450 isoform C [Spinacia oleracea]
MWPSLQGNFAVAVCISLCHSTKFLAVMQLGSPGVCLCRTSYSSRRKRPRTPTPGQYLGLGHRRKYRGGYGREDYDHRRSPRRSPYRGSRGYSPPRRSPYAERSRRYRSRSYSPYGSPDRGGYGRRSGAYGR